MGIKYTQHIENEDGWTDWFKPTPVGDAPYRLACCDCGLVHDIEFDIEDGAIIMRARQNTRSTGQKRRYLKK